MRRQNARAILESVRSNTRQRGEFRRRLKEFASRESVIADRCHVRRASQRNQTAAILEGSVADRAHRGWQDDVGDIRVVGEGVHPEGNHRAVIHISRSHHFAAQAIRDIEGGLVIGETDRETAGFRFFIPPSVGFAVRGGHRGEFLALIVGIEPAAKGVATPGGHRRSRYRLLIAERQIRDRVATIAHERQRIGIARVIEIDRGRPIRRDALAQTRVFRGESGVALGVKGHALIRRAKARNRFHQSVVIVIDVLPIVIDHIGDVVPRRPIRGKGNVLGDRPFACLGNRIRAIEPASESIARPGRRRQSVVRVEDKGIRGVIHRSFARIVSDHIGIRGPIRREREVANAAVLDRQSLRRGGHVGGGPARETVARLGRIGQNDVARRHRVCRGVRRRVRPALEGVVNRVIVEIPMGGQIDIVGLSPRSGVIADFVRIEPAQEIVSGIGRRRQGIGRSEGHFDRIRINDAARGIEVNDVIVRLPMGGKGFVADDARGDGVILRGRG